MRRDARVDGNHARIARALELFGCSVDSLAPMGKGVPDILWSRSGKAGVIEVKNPEQPPSKRKLRPAQVTWRAHWKGPYAVCETAGQAIAHVQKVVFG